MKTIYKATFLLLFILLTSCNSKTSEYKKQLIGNWKQEKEPIQITFKEDDTWEMNYNFENSKKAKEYGKYVLGDEGEVFMRYYNSQHWEMKKDTIVDLRTSIGARLLFIEGEYLINNQEDVHIRYSKQ